MYKVIRIKLATKAVASSTCNERANAEEEATDQGDGTSRNYNDGQTYNTSSSFRFTRVDGGLLCFDLLHSLYAKLLSQLAGAYAGLL